MFKQKLIRFALTGYAILVLLLELLLLLKLPIGIVVPVMSIAIGAVIMLLINNLLRLQSSISEISRKVSGEDTAASISSKELNELENVGLDIRDILAKLDRTVTNLSVHRQELRLILGSIDDALWSQNSEGKIQWANEAFNQLFPGITGESANYYWELIREPILLEHIHRSIEKGERTLVELSLGEADYLLSSGINKEADRYVFILQDISPLRQAERMKQDFVANLAHELRTPLTAIKGFSDALAESAPASESRYLEIIRSHTRRLIHLIRDLDQLIYLERAHVLEKQDIRLSTFFENLQLLIQPGIDERGLQLRIVVTPDDLRLSCDPFKFEQVFINLAQNSLRYTETGGITISAVKGENGVHFRVEDTGIGIEKQHLSRIFERFYVADPSRNRNMSGSGLGLAIVKHIIQLHGGNIRAESEPGKGTAFIFELPLV